jgi:hypothetical protein
MIHVRVRRRPSAKRVTIEEALTDLRFERILTLFFDQEGKAVREFSSQTGLLISSHFIGVTLVAGNRVANTSEIWLHPDGTLHEYLEAATWETLEGGCTQKHYIGPADEDKISLEDLKEQIAFNLESDPDEEQFN